MHHARREGRHVLRDHPDKLGRGGLIYPLFVNIMNITYILYSFKINRFYTGQTINLVRRLEEHNRGKTASSAKGMPWKLVFSKECTSRTEAVKLEKFIKRRGAARFLNDNNITVG